MKGAGNILRIIRPFLKGWPVIGLCLVIGAALGYRNLYYAIPTYQAIATLQINDKESGASAFLENFEAFSMTGLILTEVEVLRSKYLMLKALDRLDVGTTYYRYFRDQPRNLYHQNAFRVEAVMEDSSQMDKLFQFHLHAETQSLDFFYLKGEQEVHLETRLGDTLQLDGLQLRIIPEDAFGQPLESGHFAFRFNSKTALLGAFANHNLKVVLPDKEVSIVKIAFTHEVPELAADVVNTLAETYIEDFIYNKTQSASKVLGFINEQVAKVDSSLKEAESSLAGYKVRTKIVDLTLETDASLKRIADLEIRRLNFQLQETELENLRQFIQRDSLDASLTPNYESVEDPTFTDALLKLTALQAERQQLLQKYMPVHPAIQQLNLEISRIKESLRQSVENTLSTVQAKIRELEGLLARRDQEFSRLPEVEKQMIVLRRRTLTNEQVLSFLLEKQAEAAIGAAATIAFHKILERAPLPKMAVSPQKTVILGVAAMVGAILGIIFIFIWHYLRANIATVKDLEDNFETPVLGLIRNIPEKLEEVPQDFINLTTNILMAEETRLISLTAYTTEQGKSPVALNLAKAFAAIGYQTVIVDFDLYDFKLHEFLGLSPERGICQYVHENRSLEDLVQPTSLKQLHFLAAGSFTEDIPTSIVLHRRIWEMLAQLKERYDKVILNLPTLKIVVDAIPLMRASDLNLLTVRADKTRFPHVHAEIDLLNKFAVRSLYFVFIERENSKQATYKLDSTPLPGIGSGARRTLLRQLVLQVLFNRGTESLPRIGSGTRRSMLWYTMKKVFTLKNQR